MQNDCNILTNLSLIDLGWRVVLEQLAVRKRRNLLRYRTRALLSKTVVQCKDVRVELFDLTGVTNNQ